MYVALTRGMDKLYLTYANNYRNNLTNAKPSRFFDDMKYKENKCISIKFLN
jgi:superfamily I DNA/RNA helicase